MLKIENLSKYYSSNDVVSKGLENVSVEFNKGEFVAICGESGSGKSTLLNVITFMDSYDDGEIYFYGEETSYFNEDDISEFKKSHVSYIFQNYNLLDSYTVLENVMLPLLIKGLTLKEAKEKAKTLIEKVGLTHRIKNRGSQLSGGEKQRVSIARALASDAEILACDEATGNLDSENRAEIVKLIREVCSDKLVLYVTHNYEEIKDICTRTIVLKDGHIIKDVKKEEIKEEKKEKVSFDYKKINNKTSFLLAMKNLISTPKKNLLIFFILFVLSMLFSTIFSSIFTSINSYEEANLSSSPIIDENYALFMKEPNVNFELKGEVIECANYTRAIFRDNQSNRFFYTPFDIECDNFYGEIIDNSTTNICNLYIPNDSRVMYPRDTKTITLEIDGSYLTFKVCGIGYSNKIQSPLINFNIDNDYLRYKLLKTAMINQLTYSLDKYGNYVLLDNATITYSDKPIARIRKCDSQFRVNYDGKDITHMFDIEYVENDQNANEFLISVEFLESLDEDACFYATNKSDFNYNINILNEKGLRHYIPALDTEPSEVLRFRIISTICALLCPFIMFFILTRLILKRIYSSKIKEYSIVRILGINLNDMRKIVMIETFTQTTLSMLLGYISMLIIFNVLPVFQMTSLGDFNPLAFVFYAIIILLFALLLGNSFSKLLYKDSSIKVMKEEVL